MANALRNLQLFRNGTPIVGTMAYAKTTIENAFAAGDLVLGDGEPISIRYQETATDDIKGLYGVAYVNGNDKQILWANSDIQVLPPQGQSDYIYVTEGTDGSFTVSANVVTVNGATGEANGLASAYDVKQYVTKYVTETVKDKFVKEGYVKHLGEDSEGRQPGDEGYVETEDASGEAYLVLVLEGGESGTSDDIKIYVPVGTMITDYKEGHDIDFRSEVNGTFIDTALDADIHVAGLTAAIGGVGTNDTFTAGMSLSDVLKKIFVKDVDVKTTNPSVTFNMSDSTTTYEYGASVTKTLSVSGYTDGYFSPENSAYTAAKFNENNNTTGGKLNAGCVQGTESYTATTGSGTISGSTWTNTNLTLVTTLTASVPYGASTVTAKTMANQNSSKSIAAGTLTRTKTITPYYRIYAGVISGTDFSSSDFATVSTAISAATDKYEGEWFTTSGYYMEGASSVTQTSSTSTGAYSVSRGSSLVVLTQAGKTVTATYDDNSSAGTFETQVVTRTIDGNTVNYQINWLSNVSSDAAMVLYNLKVQ